METGVRLTHRKKSKKFFFNYYVVFFCLFCYKVVVVKCFKTLELQFLYSNKSGSARHVLLMRCIIFYLVEGRHMVCEHIAALIRIPSSIPETHVVILQEHFPLSDTVILIWLQHIYGPSHWISYGAFFEGNTTFQKGVIIYSSVSARSSREKKREMVWFWLLDTSCSLTSWCSAAQCTMDWLADIWTCKKKKKKKRKLI